MEITLVIISIFTLLIFLVAIPFQIRARDRALKLLSETHPSEWRQLVESSTPFYEIWKWFWGLVRFPARRFVVSFLSILGISGVLVAFEFYKTAVFLLIIGVSLVLYPFPFQTGGPPQIDALLFFNARRSGLLEDTRLYAAWRKWRFFVIFGWSALFVLASAISLFVVFR